MRGRREPRQTRRPRVTGDDYTIVTALANVWIWWHVLGNDERALPFVEEATPLSQQIGNSPLMALVGIHLGMVFESTDPSRARASFETGFEYANAVKFGLLVGAAVASLSRLSADAVSPQLAKQLRGAIDSAHEAGDTTNVLMLLDIHAQALVTTDRADSAAMLAASVAEGSAHMSNPISVVHRRETNEQLLAQLGEERLAELTAQGATLGYEDAVALAFAELDRVIAEDVS